MSHYLRTLYAVLRVFRLSVTTISCAGWRSILPRFGSNFTSNFRVTRGACPQGSCRSSSVAAGGRERDLLGFLGGLLGFALTTATLRRSFQRCRHRFT